MMPPTCRSRPGKSSWSVRVPLTLGPKRFVVSGPRGKPRGWVMGGGAGEPSRSPGVTARTLATLDGFFASLAVYKLARL